jgi:hypothetical protein
MKEGRRMRRVAILLLLGMSACGRQSSETAAQQPPAKPMAAMADPMTTARQSVMAAAAKAGVIPIPKDKGQLDRLLAMGYKVHEDHLHPPGMKECPFSMGGSVVQ